AHGVAPGSRVVFIGDTAESLDHLEVLRASGVQVVVASLPATLANQAPAGLRVIVGGKVVAARGRSRVRAAVLSSPAGRETVSCDALVLSLGLESRDGLLRQAASGLPVVA